MGIHLPSFKLSFVNKSTSVFNSNPALDDEEWPEYTKENPIYRIFNAEGDGKHPRENFGKGPMASACAFWNTYLPRLKSWTGELFPLIFSDFLFFDQNHICIIDKLACIERKSGQRKITDFLFCLLFNWQMRIVYRARIQSKVTKQRHKQKSQNLVYQLALV